MVQVDGEDLLRALKRFKSLAKQDLLASELTPDPVYWKTHAEARRTVYNRLINLIESSGSEKACVCAFDTYEGLQETKETGEQQGLKQAIELFFQIIGISPEKLKRMRENKVKSKDIADDSAFGCEYQLI